MYKTRYVKYRVLLFLLLGIKKTLDSFFFFATILVLYTNPSLKGCLAGLKDV